MQHNSEKAQIFYVLQRIDYSQTWEEIEYGLGYDLGDHFFENEKCKEKIREAAKHLWAVFNGFLNSEGKSIRK